MDIQTEINIKVLKVKDALQMLTNELINQLMDDKVLYPKIDRKYGVGPEDTAIERITQELANKTNIGYAIKQKMEDDLLQAYKSSVRELKERLTREELAILNSSINQEEKLRNIMKNYNRFQWFILLVNRYYNNFETMYYHGERVQHQRSLVTEAFEIYRGNEGNQKEDKNDSNTLGTLIQMINSYREFENLNENEMTLLKQIFEKIELLGISGPYRIELKQNPTEIDINWKDLPKNSKTPNQVVRDADTRSKDKYSQKTKEIVVAQTQIFYNSFKESKFGDLSLQDSVELLVQLYQREQSLAMNVFGHSKQMMNRIFEFMDTQIAYPILKSKFDRLNHDQPSLIKLMEDIDFGDDPENNRFTLSSIIELSMKYHVTRDLYFDRLYDFITQQGSQIIFEVKKAVEEQEEQQKKSDDQQVEEKKGEEQKMKTITSYVLAKKMSDIFMKNTRLLLNQVFKDEFMAKYRASDVLQVEQDTGYRKSASQENELINRVRSAFSQFIEQVPENSQLLAVFTNTKIKEQVQGQSDFETFFTSIEYIFKAIGDQDKFMQYNLFYLIDRIYNNKAFSFQDKQIEISKIIASIDMDSASKIKLIQNEFNQFGPTEKAWIEFKEKYGIDEQKKELISIKVLPRQMPIDDSIRDDPLNKVIPKEIQDQFNNFKKHYGEINFAQFLTPHLNYGVCEVHFTTNNSDAQRRKKIFSTSIFQMIILVTLSRQPGYQMSLMSLANETMVEIKKVQTELRGLMKPLEPNGQPVIQSKESAAQLKDESILLLNLDFQHKANSIVLNNENVLKLMPEEPPERSTVCQAIIVRILKGTRKMKYDQLFLKSSQLINKFKLSQKLFKLAIGVLMEHYCRRDDNDRSMIQYLPGND